jgi:dolichol-phosphate mannosyltransferase
MISLIVPTYNESGTIEELIERASRSLSKCDEEFEIVVVDDASQDGTDEIAEALSDKYPVRVLRRRGRLGLASAVIDGWSEALGDKLGVIDGDLQHPPEHLENLVHELGKQNADIAVASRHVEGGVSELSPIRALISSVATHMAVFVLPETLSRVRDPMSGYFMVRRQVFETTQLDPCGYKILLEVLARAKDSSVVEVPYIFNIRPRGSSKMGLRQILEYLQHLARLSISTGELWKSRSRQAIILSALFLIIYILYTVLA